MIAIPYAKLYLIKIWQEKCNSSVKTGRDGELLWSSLNRTNGTFFYSLFPKLHNTGFITVDIRSSYRRCSIKKAGLEHFTICTEKHLLEYRLAILSKRDSSTGAFLWILRNFQEHLLWKISKKGFRIFSAVKSAYSGEIFCGDKNYSFYIRKL